MVEVKSLGGRKWCKDYTSVFRRKVSYGACEQSQGGLMPPDWGNDVFSLKTKQLGLVLVRKDLKGGESTIIFHVECTATCLATSSIMCYIEFNYLMFKAYFHSNNFWLPSLFSYIYRKQCDSYYYSYSRFTGEKKHPKSS